MEIFSTAAFTKAISEGWRGRFALIEGKRCQIVRTYYRATNPSLPKDVYIGLYLPRREWADFVIYVVRRIEPMEFYIVPRGALSKDTALSSQTLDRYRDAWYVLSGKVSPGKLKRRFTIVSPKLKAVKKAAKQAGLKLRLIRPSKVRRRWPVYIQTHVRIEGRLCSLHSFSRIKVSSGCVFFRRPKSTRAEFHLYMLPDSDGPVWIFPFGAIQANNSISLGNEKLKAYENNWSLLTQPVGEISAVDDKVYKQ